MGFKIPNYDPSSFSLGREILEWLESIVFAMVIAIFLFTFVVRLAAVEGHSMEPTLYGKDRLIIRTLNYKPEIGDIVVVEIPDQDPLIKRIIATEGQKGDIDFEEGVVYRDGEALEEPYTLEPTYREEDVRFPVTVPEDCVFVMGDNRNHSTDSRDSMVGMVPEKYVIGEAVFRFMPFDSVGFLNQDTADE